MGNVQYFPNFMRYFGNFQSFTDQMFRKYLIKLGKYCTFLHFSILYFQTLLKRSDRTESKYYTERSLLLFLLLFYFKMRLKISDFKMCSCKITLSFSFSFSI